MTNPKNKLILIVDDEPDVVSYFSSLLEDAGFNVETASNGFEAIEKVKAKKPDFISLDLVMPEKSGIKFYYELRRNKEWSKIMQGSGHGRTVLELSDGYIVSGFDGPGQGHGTSSEHGILIKTDENGNID